MTRDANKMTKDHRLREIATILARGVRRYYERSRQEKSSQPPKKDSAKGLEVPGETRLSVSRVSC